MTSQRDREDLILQALQVGTAPAIGCTEPVSIALAAAVAANTLGASVERLRAQVSPNVMKNAMAVVVPGTGRPGPMIAAAAGAFGGDPAGGLRVLADMDETTAAAARAFVDQGHVSVELAEVADGLFVEVIAEGGGHRASAAICGGHTRIISVERDGAALGPSLPREVTRHEEPILVGLGLREVIDWALGVPLADIAFMDEARTLTDTLVAEGLTGDYGLGLGKVLTASTPEPGALVIEDGLAQMVVDQMVARASAASDARMGGAALACITNSGSGNQGITVTVPVLVVAEALAASDEQRLRALALAHIVALHVHARLPVLSGFCATLSAAMGAASGMLWLLGADFEAIARAVNTMAGDAAGMLCDGAGCSCTLKVSTSVAAAARAVQLSLAGIRVPGTNGIVHDDVDDTLDALGRFASQTRDAVDGTVLQIMMSKP